MGGAEKRLGEADKWLGKADKWLGKAKSRASETEKVVGRGGKSGWERRRSG